MSKPCCLYLLIPLLLLASLANAAALPVSSTIGASATVIGPLGINDSFVDAAQPESYQWLLQFATPTGNLLLIELDGTRQSSIDLTADAGDPKQSTFEIIDLADLTAEFSEGSGTYVVTIISISQ